MCRGLKVNGLTGPSLSWCCRSHPEAPPFHESLVAEGATAIVLVRYARANGRIRSSESPRASFSRSKS
ncbi:hypothetical protein SacmaDRAFT_4500 [Saccharomonospora marina XMU15]|uniref:Uncharacterized protein n=1 Tax=Saccharomonospora marina XMU15 TaxID=882083 RepID=H5XAX4_9PSEU|nr:hypothetical protein SacmaDRAFT_4500 [Saccharomonospora marina XMU15]